MLFWGIVFAICAIVEIVIPALVSVWFAAAALLMLPISLLIDNMILEIIIFLVLSLIFILTLRQTSIKFIRPKDNLRKEEVVVEKLIEDKDLQNNGIYLYELRYKGGIWTGQGTKEYEIGDRVYIKSFDGNKIIIE